MAFAAETRAPYHGRRVLVTGGFGFIGANLARGLLDLGARVALLSRPGSATWRLADVLDKLTILPGDVTDAASLAAVFDGFEPDCVFHLATPRGNDASAWRRLVEVNVLAATHLVDQLARRPSIRLVVAGSGLEYGPSARPHEEGDALLPATWHGVGKAAAGMVYGQAVRSLGLAINQLRIFHVYGPWESSHRLLPTALRAALEGKALPLTEAEIRRDWVYVGDVVEAMLKAAIADAQGEAFNIGSGVEVGNDELVDVVERVSGQSIARLPGAFPSGVSDSAHRRADIGKARTLLDWTPHHDIDRGVAATLAWLRANPHAWEGETEGRPLHV